MTTPAIDLRRQEEILKAATQHDKKDIKEHIVKALEHVRANIQEGQDA
jgi:hypothetical protein